jgi:hypothetical protein
MTRKKTETKKQSEKKTTKAVPHPKAKVTSARAEAKKPAETKKQPPPATPVQETLPASSNATPPKAPAAPRTPDPRMPPPGTLLQKRDRHGAVRCECAVEDGGVRYAGKVYRSLSAAAMAAAKDLGLVNKTQNGWTFWGITKAPRPPGDPLIALERAWERYHGNVEALVKDGVTDENRSKVVSTIRKHAQVIESLREKVA